VVGRAFDGRCSAEGHLLLRRHRVRSVSCCHPLHLRPFQVSMGPLSYIVSYSTVALVPPMSTMDVWRGIMYSVNSTGPLKREIRRPIQLATRATVE